MFYSDETAQTYKGIFQCLKRTFEYWMADWAAAITKAKNEVWKPEVTKTLKNGTDIDNKRLFCYPHVKRNIQKTEINSRIWKRNPWWYKTYSTFRN